MDGDSDFYSSSSSRKLSSEELLPTNNNNEERPIVKNNFFVDAQQDFEVRVQMDPTRKDSALGEGRSAIDEKDLQNNNKEDEVQSPTSTKKPRKHHFLLEIIVACLMGLVFGFVLQKSRVFEPEIIRLQFEMRTFLMMKVFLAAAATSQLVFISLGFIVPERLLEAREAFYAALFGKGTAAVALGSFLLGAGMSLAGTCPGIVFLQLGSLVDTAPFTLLGIIVGVLVYAIIEPYVRPHLVPAGCHHTHTVHGYFKKHFALVGGACFLGLSLAIILLEIFFPWQDDISSEELKKSDSNVFRRYAWMPEISGIFVGLLQIPCVLILQDTLGSSSSFVTCVSIFTALPGISKLQYLKKHMYGMENWWQVVYLGSACASAYLSYFLADAPRVSGVDPISAAFGGFLLAFGARLGSGCTSGHGLSGMGLLSSLSILGVAFMFAGGMLVALIRTHSLFGI